MPAHDAVTTQKTGAHLREHRFNLHVMWSSQLARSHLHVVWSSDLRTLHPHVMWSLDPVRLREALDAVLGDARKEQRLQLGGTLAKDQSLTEDALALVKTAFIAG